MAALSSAKTWIPFAAVALTGCAAAESIDSEQDESMGSGGAGFTPPPGAGGAVTNTPPPGTGGSTGLGAGGSSAPPAMPPPGSGGMTATPTPTTTPTSTPPATPSNFTPGAASGMGAVSVEPGNVIDDLEGAMGSIIMAAGRIGAWFTYNDGTAGGTQSPEVGATFLPEPVAGPDGAETLAAHTHGSGFTVWGAGMGFDLNNTGMAKSTYDASGFTGIVFWGAGTAPVRVKLLTSATTLAAEGGTCSDKCGDNHGKIVMLTSQWQQHAVAFSELTQENWGAKADFDPATVIGIQFQFAKNTPFDIWIDDIAFY